MTLITSERKAKLIFFFDSFYKLFTLTIYTTSIRLQDGSNKEHFSSPLRFSVSRTPFCQFHSFPVGCRSCVAPSAGKLMLSAVLLLACLPATCGALPTPGFEDAGYPEATDHVQITARNSFTFYPASLYMKAFQENVLLFYLF